MLNEPLKRSGVIIFIMAPNESSNALLKKICIWLINDEDECCGGHRVFAVDDGL